MYITALFVMAKKQNQPKCSSTDGWRNKIEYIHTIEYYLSIERKEELKHATAQTDLETIILIERSQIQKAIYCMILFNALSRIDKSIEIQSILVISGAWRRRKCV